MITIYGAAWCGYCQKAKKVAEDMKLAHMYRDVESDGVYDELVAKKPAHASSTIPQIWWDDRYIGGYNELMSEIENTIGGYGDGKV